MTNQLDELLKYDELTWRIIKIWRTGLTNYKEFDGLYMTNQSNFDELFLVSLL